MSRVLHRCSRVAAMAVVTWLAALALPGSLQPASGTRDVRVATYNVRSVGRPGSEQFRALVDVLERVGADVVLLQEVDDDDGDLRWVQRLAGETAYPFRCVSETSGTLSGNLHTACLSRVPIVECRSWSAAELSGDSRANDITRDILEVHVRVRENRDPWGFFTVHLKGGGAEADRFRRQVELLRALTAVRAFRRARPGSPVVVAGDFNEDVARAPFGKPVFHGRPIRVPRTLRLGEDVAWPIAYRPFKALRDAGFEMALASHEDHPLDLQTRWVSGRRLDYLWFDRHLRVDGAEVYDSCDDNGVDDPPRGGRLSKIGDPLPCRRTGKASDHFPVIADLVRIDDGRDGPR